MTMFLKNRVIDNLREEKKKLKDKLEAVKTAVNQIETLDLAYRQNELVKLPRIILKILEDEG